VSEASCQGETALANLKVEAASTGAILSDQV